MKSLLSLALGTVLAFSTSAHAATSYLTIDTTYGTICYTEGFEKEALAELLLLTKPGPFSPTESFIDDENADSIGIIIVGISLNDGHAEFIQTCE